MPVITLSWKDTEAQRWLSAIQGYAMNMAPVWMAFGGRMVNSVRQNFMAGGRPVPWKPVSREGKPLIDTGRLMNSIHWKPIPDGVAVGTNVAYASIHQFGGHTKPHIIRPKVKKALFWAGAPHPCKAVHHPGSVIPARPFLMVQDDDWHYLMKLAATFLVSGRAA